MAYAKATYRNTSVVGGPDAATAMFTHFRAFSRTAHEGSSQSLEERLLLASLPLSLIQRHDSALHDQGPCQGIFSAHFASAIITGLLSVLKI
jgi:hypothetical protein